MKLPKLINNINERVIDNLKRSIATSSFSIYAFEMMKGELENTKEFHFILTSSTFVKDKLEKEKQEFYIPKMSHEHNLYNSDFELIYSLLIRTLLIK